MAPRKTTTKKKVKKSVSEGVAHIHSTFNNTIISISEKNGKILAWSSSGAIGFKGSKKSTPYAATIAAQEVGKKIKQFGMHTLSVRMKGPGPGREAALRSLQAQEFEITDVKNVTPVPHNGCLLPKRKRRI